MLPKNIFFVGVKALKTNLGVFALIFSALVLAACSKQAISPPDQSALYDANAVWHSPASAQLPEIIIIPESNSRHNNKARVKLLVKTGALQETDEQRGLAHFVEHMAFRGTAAYPEQQLHARLRDIGIQLGRHSNAYVTFDHTAYWLDLDDLNRGQLEAALDILAQWAFHIDFTESALKEEMPVIVEEWRRRQLDEDRVQPRLQAALFNGSKHLTRLPILGEKSDIEATTVEKLRQFYQQWYHPENMLVVVTGDVDPEHTRQLINQYFIQQDNARPGSMPETFDIEPDAIAEYIVLSDPFMPVAVLNMMWFYPIPEYSLDSERQALALELVLGVLRNRLDSKKLSTNGVVADVRISRNRRSANVRDLNMMLTLTEPDFALAYHFLEHEVLRMKALGISEHEWRTQVAEWQAWLERLQDSPNRLANLAREFWLYQEPILNQSSHQQRRLALLQQISIEEGIAALKKVTAGRNVNLALYPHGTEAPSADQLNAYRLAAQQAPFTPLTTQQEPKWPPVAESQGIVSEISHPEEITEWQLANGISAFYRYSAAEPERVYLRLIAKGGTGLLNDDQVLAALMASDVINEGGQAGLNSTQLKQWRQRLDITQSFYIDFEERSFYLAAPIQNIEQGLLALHHRVKAYQLDEELWQFQHAQALQLVQQFKDHPHMVWNEARDRALWQNDIRFRSLQAVEDIAAVTLDQGQTFYQQWVQGNPGYRLAIVGDLSAKQARELVERYFSSLPAAQSQPEGQVSPQPQSAKQVRVAGSGQQHASIELYYYLDKAKLPQPWQDTPSTLLRYWLNEQLFDRIRTQSGFAYSINAAITGNNPVHARFALKISLQTDPDKVDLAIAEIQTLLADAAKQAPSTTQVQTWQQILADERMQARQRPRWLLDRIAYSHILQAAPWQRIAPIEEAPEAESLALLLSQIIEEGQFIELVWLP